MKVRCMVIKPYTIGKKLYSYLKKEGKKKMKNMDILIRDAQDGTLENLILDKSTLKVFEILFFDYEIDRYDIDELSPEYGHIILTGEIVEGKYSEEYEIVIGFDREKCIGVTCSSL